MNENPAYKRILLVAMDLFLRQGVKKTNLTEVARGAGLTRVTVYRYFGDRKGLVRAVCQRITAVFQDAAHGFSGESMEDVDKRLGRLGSQLSKLPRGNFLAKFEEIRGLYPDVYDEFRSARQEAVDRLFGQAVAAAQREGMLRDGLHQDVLKAIFCEAVMHLIENPSLISSNVPLADIVSTVTEVFRHGILK
jgi:AcrR family transcriptional regulator